MNDPLKDLADLTDAIYQAELGKLRALTAREIELRRDITLLEEYRRDNMALPDVHLHAVRQIGADVLWQGWVSRKRQELNIQLAQVLAQKELMLPPLRRAFGKKIAACEILDGSQSEQRVQLEKNRQRYQEDLQLLKADRT